MSLEQIREGTTHEGPWICVSVDTNIGPVLSSCIKYGGPADRPRALRAARKAVNNFIEHNGARLTDGSRALPLDPA